MRKNGFRIKEKKNERKTIEEKNELEKACELSKQKRIPATWASPSTV